MKDYEEAKLSIVYFKSIDIITGSGDEEIDIWDDWDDNGEGGGEGGGA